MRNGSRHSRQSQGMLQNTIPAGTGIRTVCSCLLYDNKFLDSDILPFNLIQPIIILLEGFVSVALEILTIRQLLPVAGGSVIVTIPMHGD